MDLGQRGGGDRFGLEKLEDFVEGFADVFLEDFLYFFETGGFGLVL
jgi:hypothetical protein